MTVCLQRDEVICQPADRTWTRVVFRGVAIVYTKHVRILCLQTLQFLVAPLRWHRCDGGFRHVASKLEGERTVCKHFTAYTCLVVV